VRFLRLGRTRRRQWPPGFGFGAPEHKLGIKGSPTAQIVLEEEVGRNAELAERLADARYFSLWSPAS